MAKNIPLNFLSPPIPDHRLDTSFSPSGPSLHDRIQSALEEDQAGLQQSSLQELVEKISHVFPAQVETYENMNSKLTEAEEHINAKKRVDEVEQELKIFNSRLLAAWNELVAMGNINLKGLKSMVNREADSLLNPLVDSAIWPEGFDPLDYDHGSGSGGGFIGSDRHEIFVRSTLPIIQERVDVLVAAVSAWHVANTEAAAYLAEVLDEDQPVDLEQ